MDTSGVDLIIVGAGFYGATIAEQAAARDGLKVLVMERRRHVGGNAYSEVDPETGIEIHRYGAHIFHTSNETVWRYLTRFATFNDYRHRVFTSAGGRVYSFPINLGTLCQFFGRHLTPDEAREMIRGQAAELVGKTPANLEERAISMIGRPLYEAFIRGYTAKQWQVDPRDLPESVIRRLPVRFDFNDRYFSDTYEGLPENGYTDIFKRMLSHPNIKVLLGVDYFEVRHVIDRAIPVVFTGPIDRYFDYREGTLGWRTTHFETETHGVSDYQGTSVMNYADEAVPFTRIVEFRHFHPHRKYTASRTVIVREYSRSATRQDEPFYPVDTQEDRHILRRYKQLAENEQRVHFGGRLGTYCYIDMHQAIAMALKDYESVLRPQLTGGAGPLKRAQHGS